MAAGFYRKDQLLADSRPPFPNLAAAAKTGSIRLADQPNIAGSQHSDGKNGAAQAPAIASWAVIAASRVSRLNRQVVGEVPGKVARAANVPEGEQATNLAVSSASTPSVSAASMVSAEGITLSAVHSPMIIDGLCTPRYGNHIQLGVGGQQRECKVVVYVAFIPASANWMRSMRRCTSFKQRVPCRGHRASAQIAATARNKNRRRRHRGGRAKPDSPRAAGGTDPLLRHHQ